MEDDIYNNLNSKFDENMKFKRLEKLKRALPMAKPMEDVDREIKNLDFNYNKKRKHMNYHFAMLKNVKIIFKYRFLDLYICTYECIVICIHNKFI